MDQNSSLDDLREKILIHGIVCQGASDVIDSHGDQDFAAGVYCSYKELKDSLNAAIKELTGKYLF